jgi:hypothetical protein
MRNKQMVLKIWPIKYVAKAHEVGSIEAYEVDNMENAEEDWQDDAVKGVEFFVSSWCGIGRF